VSGRLAAITGGTGFLGRHCAVALAARGWRVRLLVRRDPTHPLLARIPIELVPGDLDDPAALRRLAAGADAVVHAAGATRAAGAAAFRAANVAGSARLADAVARAAPDCRFVHVSSQAARHPALSPYAASKREGEASVTARLGGTSWVILRPGIIYGPWDAATLALLRLARGYLVPVPTPPEPRLAMVHARDAAAAIAAFCDAGPSGGTYELCDAAAGGHAWRDIVAAARAHGAPRFVPVPDGAVLAAGAGADAWAALTGRPSLFGRGKAREILHRDWRPDPALRPPPHLWAPEIPLAQGLQDVLPNP
jgi:nucleoside-diphosphate-sugar epimerase